MNFLKYAAFGVAVLMAAAVCSAQQKFPRLPGEWTTTTTSSAMAGQEPTVMLYCLNDELWTRSLTQDKSCTVTQLNVTTSGISYNISCEMKTFQMKGKVDISFDGMTHMAGTGSFDMTMNGKTTHSTSQTDYRWKGATCDPNKDMNLKFQSKQH